MWRRVDLTGQSWRPNATDLHLSFLMMMLWFTCIQNIFLHIQLTYSSWNVLYSEIYRTRSLGPRLLAGGLLASWLEIMLVITACANLQQTMLGQHTFEVGTFVYFHRNMFERVERWEKYWRIFYKCEHLYSAPAQASEPAPAVLKMKEISVSKCFQMEATYNCNLSICAPNAGAMAT